MSSEAADLSRKRFGRNKLKDTQKTPEIIYLVSIL
jgi:hypothetical protein